jgi:hypothetical protein
MTREDAKATFKGQLTEHLGRPPFMALLMIGFSWIDKIYFYFESQTCERCEYWNKIPKSDYICTNTESACFRRKSCSDYGCNKWEKKNDKRNHDSI